MILTGSGGLSEVVGGDGCGVDAAQFLTCAAYVEQPYLALPRLVDGGVVIEVPELAASGGAVPVRVAAEGAR